MTNQKPWYAGWANCDDKATKILREYYPRPSFLPAESTEGRRDWIFIGTPGWGAPSHLDDVTYPSWQAQVIVLFVMKSPVFTEVGLLCYINFLLNNTSDII